MVIIQSICNPHMVHLQILVAIPNCFVILSVTIWIYNNFERFFIYQTLTYILFFISFSNETYKNSLLIFSHKSTHI